MDRPAAFRRYAGSGRPSPFLQLQAQARPGIIGFRSKDLGREQGLHDAVLHGEKMDGLQRRLFQDFGGTLTYSAQDPATCSIEVTVQAASLDTRAPGRDKVLRSDDFFAFEKFPRPSFGSTGVKATGKETYDVEGDLTLHGATKRVTVPAKRIGVRVMPGIGDFAGFETTFNIDRRDFGVLGSRGSGNTMAIDPAVVLHLIIGGVRE